MPAIIPPTMAVPPKIGMSIKPKPMPRNSPPPMASPCLVETLLSDIKHNDCKDDPSYSEPKSFFEHRGFWYEHEEGTNGKEK